MHRRIRKDAGDGKDVEFRGDSLARIREFPEGARHDVGYQLYRLQHGEQPSDWKPMRSIGRGVEEIRLWDDDGTYRVIYTARFPQAIYVLHAFHKRTRATSPRDIELARARFIELKGIQT